MKSKLLLIATLLSSHFLFSQTDVKIKYHYANIKVPYPAVVKHLTKENNYKLVYPEKLTYYGSHQQMMNEFVWFPSSELLLKAKMAKDNPELYFAIEAKGLGDLESKGVRKTANGYVIDYTYHFPCKLLVQDNTKKTLYSVDVYTENESLPIVYFKNLGAYERMNYTPQYFATENEALGFQAATKEIGKHIEKLAILKAYSEIAKMITVLYYDYTERHQLQWADIPDAKAVPEYLELNTAGGQMNQAYDLLHDANAVEANKLLQAAKQVFEKYKDVNNAVIGTQVKTMILYNLAWISLLSGDAKTTIELYDKCNQSSERTTSYGWYEMKTMADYSVYRDKIKKMTTK